jgi:glutamate dehydrogenase (NAD(P)+)
LLRRGEYLPGADMGTANSDVRHVLETAGVRVAHRDLVGTRSGDYTAQTVFAAAQIALERRGLSLAGSSAAIEGFGKVGRTVAELLASAGVRVVAISTSRGAIVDSRGLDVQRLSELAARSGSEIVDRYPEAERIERSLLVELPVDLLAPCARHDSVHAANADRISARVVCAGANNPVTPEAERILWQKGVLCLPDFVTNAGGVLGGTMEFAGVNPRGIAAFVERTFSARVDELVAEADRRGVTPRQIAEPIALQRFVEVRRRTERGGAKQLVFQAALTMHRHGWSPAALVARLSLPYFEALLGRSDRVALRR